VTRSPASLAASIVGVLVSGVLYGLAFPTHSIRALAWVALVPLLVATRSGGAGRAVLLAWLWTLASTWTLNDWFPHAVSSYYLQPAWVGYGFFVGVATLTAAPAFVFFVLSWRRLAAVDPLWRPLLAAAAWTTAELVRTRLLGDPWALLGYSQVGVLPMMQIADLAGVYGIGFVLAAVNAACAESWLARRGLQRSGRQLAAVGLVAAVVVATFAYGGFRLRGRGSVGDTPVAIVQANLDMGSQWRSELYGRNLESHLRLTWNAIENDPATLVVWPESAMTFFLDDEASYRAAIGRVLAPRDVELLTGGPRTPEDAPGVHHNTVFLVETNGEIRAWYDKQDLLPFAEYFPLPQLDFLRRRFGRVREFTPGGEATLLPARAGRIGVAICNESLFAAPARARVAHGAELLAVLANDSWVGSATYAEQAFEMSVLRAVEQRRFLVRASTSGPSAIVEPSGRIQTRTAPGSRATLRGRVRPRAARTWYGRVGDCFAWIAAAVTLAALARPRQR
jgi:apolipoprotein N-acyltransferase